MKNLADGDTEKRLREISQAVRMETVSSEAIRSIARDEAQSATTQHENDCVNGGPICSVREEMREMREEISGKGGIREELANFRADRAASDKSLKAMLAICTVAGVVIQLIGVIWKARHG